MKSRLSLRERLVLLVVAAVLPLSALSVWSALREMRSATQFAKSQLGFSAALLAAHQQSTVESARQLLTAIGSVPGIRSLDGARCEKYFGELRGRYPIYGNIGILDLQGDVVCHAAGSARSFNAAGLPSFKEALARGEFTIGRATIGRSGRPVVPFGLPLAEGGKLTGLVFVSLDLLRAAETVTRLQIPAGARLLVADRRGLVLMEHPAQPHAPLGRRLGNAQLLEALRLGTPAGDGEGVDLNGVERVFAYASTPQVGGEAFLTVVSMDLQTIEAASLASLRNELLALGLTLLLGIAGAWWVGGRSIVRPAREILGAVRRLERGNLDSRVPLQGRQRSEFGRIAAAFNLMAESLQLRQVDLVAELGRSRSAYEVLDQVLNSMQEGLIAVNAQGRFLMYNDAASRLFEMEDASVLPEHWPVRHGLYTAPDGPLVEAQDLPLSRAMRGESGTMEIYARNAMAPEGRLLHCSYQPLSGGESARGGLVVFSDITELRRLSAEEAAQIERLQHTQRELHSYTLMLQRTADAAQFITARHSVEEAMQEVADQARAVIGAQQAVVSFTVDNNWAQVVTALSVTEKFAPYRSMETPPDGSGIYALVCETGRPLRMTQAQLEAHPRWKSFGGHGAEHPPLNGLLAVGLTGTDGKNIGLLMLSSKDAGDFNERDEHVARELAQIASIAIENARLLQQVRELNAGLESRIAERTAELSRQERLYRTLAEQAPEVVWTTAPEGNVTFLNRAWTDLVGGTAEEWLGYRWLQRVHPDDLPVMSHNWLNSRETLQPYTGTRRILARDGNWHVMSYRAAPVLDDQGRVASWVGIDSDITGQKAIELALRNSNRELETFSYSVSHDLRGPLGAIGGFTRALAHRLEGGGDERAAHFMSRIQAGVAKMEVLIDAMLSLANVVRAPLAHEVVDLGAIARDTLDDLRAQANGREVAVAIQDGLSVRGDPRLLRIALENLLGNAWKFTSRTANARIEVGKLAEGGVFFVRDNGVGFDMAYAGKLFGAFQRLHTEAEFPGTGIGLATVSRVVARHQGRVWAESAPGEGTTFFFTLSDVAPPAWLAGDATG